MPRKVAPRGLPTWRRRVLFSWFKGVVDEEIDGGRSRGFWEEGDGVLLLLLSEMLVLRRKSWVTAMPMLAKDREVRSQARKVRSVCEIQGQSALISFQCEVK